MRQNRHTFPSTEQTFPKQESVPPWSRCFNEFSDSFQWRIKRRFFLNELSLPVRFHLSLHISAWWHQVAMTPDGSFCPLTSFQDLLGSVCCQRGSVTSSDSKELFRTKTWNHKRSSKSYFIKMSEWGWRNFTLDFSLSSCSTCTRT